MTCQNTSHKVPVKIYMQIIICWCTVPVEICAVLLFMWLCRFVFGDCLPLSIALHHLPTSINRATTLSKISTKRVDLITHPKHHSSFWGGGLNSLLNTQGRAHNRTMPKVSRCNPRADSSDDESPQKKPSRHTTAKKPSSRPGQGIHCSSCTGNTICNSISLLLPPTSEYYENLGWWKGSNSKYARVVIQPPLQMSFCCTAWSSQDKTLPQHASNEPEVSHEVGRWMSVSCCKMQYGGKYLHVQQICIVGGGIDEQSKCCR